MTQPDPAQAAPCSLACGPSLDPPEFEFMGSNATMTQVNFD